MRKHFQHFNTTRALLGLGADIKSLARQSCLGDQELAEALHMGTHTISNV